MTQAVNTSKASEIQLRPVTESDLPILFEYQREPEANEMAAFPARDRDAFIGHWTKILGDETVVALAVVVDGCVAGMEQAQIKTSPIRSALAGRICISGYFQRARLIEHCSGRTAARPGWTMTSPLGALSSRTPLPHFIVSKEGDGLRATSTNGRTLPNVRIQKKREVMLESCRWTSVTPLVRKTLAYWPS